MRTGAQAVAFKRVVAFVFCSVTCAPMWAQTDAGESDHQFNTAGQSLTQALKNFAQTTNQQIIFNEDMVAGMTAPALQGQYTPQDALGKLLKGTGLTAEKSPSGALMIKQHATGDSIVLAQGPLRQAQANQGAAAGSPGQGSHPGDERGSPTNTGTDGARSDSEENQPDGMAEVKVTGSRIVQNGYQAPTPVTVATAADLAMGSPTDISDGLRKLPNFVGSSGPNASALFSAAPIRGNVLNLRGLGPNRTLVLLDGVRVPATNYQNTVDVDVLPQLLVERVDIVTGGASASYGSDAVAGVVNYVLDTNFTGLKGVAQGGISTFGDDGNQRFGVAFGTHIGDRGHLIASAEYYNSDGYQMSDRPKLNDSGLAVGSVVGSSSPPGSAANPYVNVQNVRVSFLAPGGYAASGPFGINSANPVYFEAPGLYRPLNFGAPTGTNNVFKYPSDFFTLNDLQAAAAIRNVNLFARASYDLGAETTAYVQVIAAQSKNSTNAVPNEQGFPPDQLFSGNAFLAPALQAMLTSTNTASFQYSKYFNDQPIIRTLERINNYDEAAGIKGKLFGRFTWTLDYAHGTSIDNVAQPGQFNLPYFYAAIDAVVDPATGRTVCYPQLSTDPVIAARYAGCQPFNLFGFGAASKAAVAYTTQGVDQYKAVNTTNDVALNFAGPLVSLPAGPLSASLGFEYRTESLRLTSNGDPANPPDFTGLRGVVLPHQWFLTNQAVTDASENVREEYAELAVPLFKNLPLIKSLDLNGAARLTRYSTTGQARTWKFGATWQAVDDLLIRATRSRDIRAPTLYDLFSGAQTTQASALDPHTGINSGFFSVSSGNPNLQPEVGYTTTVGFSYQPGWLEGFAMSVDYYRIDMTGAVATLHHPGAPPGL